MINSGSNFLKSAMVLILVCLIASCLLRFGWSQVSGSTTVKVQPAETEVRVGDTFTVSVIVESVYNLYGLDMTLLWDDSILQFQSATLLLGQETHPDGVLHEDSGSEIYVAYNNASDSEYHLAATSVNPASSFNGSGIVFRVDFKSIAAGYSSLSLETELADHPLPGETANLIEHSSVGGSVESTERDSNGFGDGDLFVFLLIAVAVVVIVVVVFFVYSRRR